MCNLWGFACAFCSRVPNVGVEDFFSNKGDYHTQDRTKFDKIIFLDTLRHLTDSKQFFSDVLQHMSELSKVLIIHRAAPINTLPVFDQALKRLHQYDQSYLKTIEGLKELGLEVFWEIESIPVITNKYKWFLMLKHRFPPELKIVSDSEILQGLRELSEGSMKYSVDQVEFLDRLLFITVQRPVQRYPLLGRKLGIKEPIFVGKGLQFELPVTSDIASIVEAKIQKEELKRAKSGFQR